MKNNNILTISLTMKARSFYTVMLQKVIKSRFSATHSFYKKLDNINLMLST